ncbi:pitrilysin family protein [Lewinella sp. W8]|uniref:M16 family metallopeptidase n=1 Tax=Lewinella sp. W8 TaxID=2528208 RepID=UPI001068BB8C|nr:pitrilysin family protein [Lewinella sp. W8]MTB49963.1 insulinase family protein [Lewinella sp. W8]
MQRIFFGLLALLLIAACSTPQQSTTNTSTTPTMEKDFRAEPPAPGPAPEIQLGDFQDFKLDNGLQVVLVENHKLPRVSYQLFVDVPPHLEGEYAGAGDMMGSMLRRATSTKTKEEIDEAVDFIGASLSTSSSGAFAATISKYKEDLLEMMSEVVLDAQFPEAEFAKVKSEAEAGLAQALTDPGAISQRVRRVMYYGADHPYGELTTEESLANVTLDVVKDYYETYFVPNRSYLVMVGDLTREEAERLAKSAFSDWKPGRVPVPSYATPKRPEGVKVSFVPRSGAVQSNITIGHPVELEPGNTRAIHANIMNQILGGGGFSSRLFQNIREDKGYTYGANSSLSNDELVGNLRAFANVRNEVTDSAIVEFLYELNKISTEPVMASELERTKKQITGSFGRALESPQRIASYALNTIRYGLDRDFYPTYLQRVEATKTSDLLKVAQELVSPKSTHIIVVGDKAVADKLARFATSGKVDFYDASGNPIDMAAMEAPTDLDPETVVASYLDAIGGKDQLMKVENIAMTMEASIQGQTIQQTMFKSGGDKFSSQTKMMGQVMADQRFNAGKASITQMGNKTPLAEEQIAALKSQSALFPEIAWMDSPENLSIEGTEMVDGKPAIILAVAEGENTVRYFFDQETGMKVRSVTQQGPTTITTTFSDYQEVGGVKFPHVLKVEGAMPFPLEMKVIELNVNTEIDPALFKVE